MYRTVLICAALCLAWTALEVCSAQDIRVPDSTIAGAEATILTTGSGKATFYLLGPGVSRKSDVSLGEEIHLAALELRNAGEYLAVVCSTACRSASFYVTASKPASITFLVHPSRVPVSQGEAVSGVVLPFDQFHNQVLTPIAINFQLTTEGASLFSQPARTQDGIAWFRTASSKSAGTLQVVASLDDLSVRRAVQQVASDACNLRITGQRTPAGVMVETEPVHDCAGNILPDGTIITFTATEQNRKSTVDAPIKRGIARALMTEQNAAVISVASGVTLGNELRIGGKP
jgi:hypothetical protein